MTCGFWFSGRWSDRPPDPWMPSERGLSCRRQAWRGAVILAGLFLVNPLFVLTAGLAGLAAAAEITSTDAAQAPATRQPAEGGDPTDALVALAVAVVLVGMAAWAALVLRGLSKPRSRSRDNHGRHRR